MSVVTRTMPVGNGGKFTPEARAIYELVLEMQTVHLFAMLKLSELTPTPPRPPSKRSSLVCTGTRCSFFVTTYSCVASRSSVSSGPRRGRPQYSRPVLARLFSH